MNIKIFRKYQFFLILCSLSIVILNVGCSSSIPKAATSYNSKDKVIENEVLLHYKNWRGTPYLYGGSTKKGIDCSALINNFFGKYHGMQMPRVTDSLIKKGVPASDLKPGDLIFFKTGKGTTGLHVGIYYKNNQFLHAGTSKGVMLSSLNNSYWKDKYLQTRRILPQG